MEIKKILKGSLISLAVLGMIGGSINPSTVNAHRRYRVHTQLHRRHFRRNKRTKGYRKSRKHQKHSRSRYVRTNRKVRHRRKTTRKLRIPKRTKRTWKLYRKNGSLAGTFHNYKEYKYAKGWLNWFNNYETKPNGRRKHKRINKRTNHRINNSNDSNNNSQDQNSSDQDSNVAQTLAEFKQQTLTDLNRDRQAHGVAPLTETPELDQLANTRAQQVKSNFNHVSGGNYAENLGETEAGETDLTDNTPVTNNNGYDMANNEEDSLMNHDAASDWGHRGNILNSSYTQVGIGTSYDPTDTEGFPYKLVEDFE